MNCRSTGRNRLQSSTVDRQLGRDVFLSFVDDVRISAIFVSSEQRVGVGAIADQCRIRVQHRLTVELRSVSGCGRYGADGTQRHSNVGNQCCSDILLR